MQNRPTLERLREFLVYDPDTGSFVRTKRTSYRVKVGDIAGSLSGRGYWIISIAGKFYPAHRLAWFYMTGEWPKEQIDHINGIRTDNRWANLRLATAKQNRQNMTRPKSNTSGYKGVTWSKRAKKWQAQIMKNYQHHYLGLFETAEDAHKAYCEAAEKHFGEFARF